MAADGQQARARGIASPFSAAAAILLRLLPALLVCVLPVRQSQAAYPLESMTLTLPATEGSQSSILYALIQRFARQHTTAPIRLNHIPGRGGSYAWSFLKDKPGNGYVLAALHFPSAMLLAADKDRAFSPDDMTSLAVFAYAANALWVAEDSSIRTLDDLVRQARDSDYGLIVAGVGRYTDHQMAHLIFSRSAGVKMAYLPLTGTAESVSAVREKRAAACWGYALARSSMPGLRPLAVAAPERRPALPDTPTFRERNMEVISGQHFGLAAPAEAREETREAVAAFFLDVFSNQDLRDEAAAVGFEPEPLPPRDMPAFMGKQQIAVETFLRDYPMFSKGAALPLSSWIPRRQAGETPNADAPKKQKPLLPLPDAGSSPSQ